MQREPSARAPTEDKIERLLDLLQEQCEGAALLSAPLAEMRQELQRRFTPQLALREQQDFRSLVEKFPDVVARFDRDYRYTYVSPHIEIYTGIAPEGLIGKTHREAGLPSQLCDLWEAKLTEAFATGLGLAFEFEFTAPAGERHWHEARVIPEMNPISGQVESVMCVGREITELKRAQEDVRQVHERFISTLEHISEGFAALDRHWRYSYVNDVAAGLLGKSKEQLLGRTPWESFLPREASVFLSEFELALEDNTSREFEDFCASRNAWYMCRCYPSAEGAVLFLTDITQRKRAEQALRDSEEHFRLLVEGVKDYALFLLDPQGHIVSWNTGAQRIKGYRAEEILGRHLSGCYTPEDVEQGRPQQDLDTAAREGSCHREGWMVCKDGSRFWADMLITALRNADGSLRGFAEVTRDITDRKRAEEALREAKERAENACAIKDQFLAVLSHELRTPLTPVLAALSLLEKSKTQAESDADVAIIRRNVELEARLIDDLLDMTRISRGKVELRPEVLDVHTAIQQALDICQTDIRAKGLEVDLALGARLNKVQADPARMQQVFWNLLKNAVKFTPEHGRIWVHTTNVGKGRLRIEIGDTGMGIETDLLPRLFNAFEQGDKSTTRRFGGLGLGLTISKTIIGMHGGTITARSEGKGTGAVFTIELNTTTAAPSSTSGLPAARQASESPLTVLFVEDHEDTRRVMTRLLRASGYIVKTAGGVHEALGILDSERIDVLVSDLGLPDGSGYDIMQSIRGRKATKGIALSGYGMDEDIQHSEQAGFSRHLTKPVQPRDLNGAIRQVLAM